ncbi:hypothetical protein CBR_g50646 [Chara braunii]|uniref:Uncharacterized protein n=1 Tax=Chara braunii TaxID=69332 RepID=A0A388M741_CHABU|nr:hypothetical protein CBR_g50646 [Chara braunii]|eukprot:GBG90398.1 hypothetical protein CBR_g50646 [Chara braunii]
MLPRMLVATGAVGRGSGAICRIPTALGAQRTSNHVSTACAADSENGARRTSTDRDCIQSEGLHGAIATSAHVALLSAVPPPPRCPPPPTSPQRRKAQSHVRASVARAWLWSSSSSGGVQQLTGSERSRFDRAGHLLGSSCTASATLIFGPAAAAWCCRDTRRTHFPRTFIVGTGGHLLVLGSETRSFAASSCSSSSSSSSSSSFVNALTSAFSDSAGGRAAPCPRGGRSWSFWRLIGSAKVEHQGRDPNKKRVKAGGGKGPAESEEVKVNAYGGSGSGQPEDVNVEGDRCVDLGFAEAAERVHSLDVAIPREEEVAARLEESRPPRGVGTWTSEEEWTVAREALVSELDGAKAPRDEGIGTRNEEQSREGEGAEGGKEEEKEEEEDGGGREGPVAGVRYDLEQFVQVGGEVVEEVQEVIAFEIPAGGDMTDQQQHQQQQEEEGGKSSHRQAFEDDMSEAYGEAYATRSADEGFGERYSEAVLSGSVEHRDVPMKKEEPPLDLGRIMTDDRAGRDRDARPMKKEEPPLDLGAMTTEHTEILESASKDIMGEEGGDAAGMGVSSAEIPRSQSGPEKSGPGDQQAPGGEGGGVPPSEQGREVAQKEVGRNMPPECAFVGPTTDVKGCAVMECVCAQWNMHLADLHAPVHGMNGRGACGLGRRLARVYDTCHVLVRFGMVPEDVESDPKCDVTCPA